MILIFSHHTSARLSYTSSFIFKELAGVDVEITTDEEKFKEFDGVKISYTANESPAPGFWIGSSGLLFEQGITTQSIECFESNGNKAFYKTSSPYFPFDIFAATFYLLSRYEEYLPQQKDMYGRYAHENSLAFKEGFLQLPLINSWVNDLVKALQEKYPTFNFQPSTFNFLPTYDIDIAYSYKHKGWLRNVAGFLQAPSLERISVLSGSKKDPFDSYDWLNELHQQHKLQPLYFFLVAEKIKGYDKNILPSKNAIQELIKLHAKKYTIGIHPSWQSGDDIAILKNEKAVLENISGQQINQSRQHYIRFNLPDGYRKLLDADITDDYSMGYGSINGFRASVASSFYWYDVEKEEQTNLRIHPFCFMEANSFYEQKFSPAQTLEELMYYLNICKSVNGKMITIWHNNFLGTAKEFAGWKEVYEAFIAQVQQ